MLNLIELNNFLQPWRPVSIAYHVCSVVIKFVSLAASYSSVLRKLSLHEAPLEMQHGPGGIIFLPPSFLLMSSGLGEICLSHVRIMCSKGP
jgi:hypothetical protein